MASAHPCLTVLSHPCFFYPLVNHPTPTGKEINARRKRKDAEGDVVDVEVEEAGSDAPVASAPAVVSAFLSGGLCMDSFCSLLLMPVDLGFAMHGAGPASCTRAQPCSPCTALHDKARTSMLACAHAHYLLF